MTIPEWWLVFLPIIFVLGWFAARLDIRHIVEAANKLPRAYLRGLSHLLRSEDDRALDAFLEAQPMDPQSMELQFAIGELFRRRGEHERALRVHHGILNRDDLSAEIRRRAMWELARDYFKIGFWDHAETQLKTLADSAPEYRERALEMTLTICQRERDFPRALETLEKFPAQTAGLRRAELAQLRCQCADALPPESAEAKRKLLQDALKANAYCDRASLALGDLLCAEGRFAEGAESFLSVERQRPSRLWMAAPKLLAARAAQGKAEGGKAELERWLREHPSPELLNAVAGALSRHCGGAAGLRRSIWSACRAWTPRARGWRSASPNQTAKSALTFPAWRRRCAARRGPLSSPAANADTRRTTLIGNAPAACAGKHWMRGANDIAAVLGGAFDPPHAGHVFLARAALADLAAREALVIPNGDPRHREVCAPWADRVAMCELAFAGIAGVKIRRDESPARRAIRLTL